MTEPAGQVLIRAGVPGKPDLTVEHGKPYPNTTTDVAKLLAERGFTVTYDLSWLNLVRRSAGLVDGV